MKKILIADDILTNRALLKQTLNALGDYEVIEAVDGNDAVAQYEKEKPDLILMDIMMPELDGRQATTLIKSKMGDDYVPIIFITALNSDESLATALESGGDDFIGKPFNVEVLASKIHAHLRIRELTQQINIKNEVLVGLNQKLIHEKKLIQHFFENALKQSFLDEKIIKYHMSSKSAFNGDLLLVERAPNGGFYLVLGDFSGHGLTAAMGTLPVAMTFFKMVAESHSVGDIAFEINSQLHKLMPLGMFFTATILELNRQASIMSVWMGGMPENYWFSKDGELKGLIHSQHMPLGILDDDEFNSLTQSFSVEPEDKLYLYSDGVIEAKNLAGELFGDERLKDVLVKNGDNRFDLALKSLNDFSGDEHQNDDITFVELNCCVVAALENKQENLIKDNALPWSTSVALTAKDMRSSDTVRKLSNILSSMPYLSRHNGVLHVLLSEIYSNSLEHSILNIKSADKTDNEHFIEYYKHRDDALVKLEDNSIVFNFNFIVEESNHYLEIQVTDSGSGYQKEDFKNTDEMLHGRGLNIISSFSEKVSFSEDGKTLNVLYKL